MHLPHDGRPVLQSPRAPAPSTSLFDDHFMQDPYPAYAWFADRVAGGGALARRR